MADLSEGGHYGLLAHRPHDTHAKIIDGCNGILTVIPFFAVLFFLLEPRHTYLRTWSTKNEKKRAAIAGGTTSPFFDIDGMTSQQ